MFQKCIGDRVTVSGYLHDEQHAFQPGSIRTGPEGPWFGPVPAVAAAHGVAVLRDIRIRSAELNNDRNTKLAQLAEIEATQPIRAQPELLDFLPTGPVDLDRMPEKIARDMFEAFRLEIRYDHRINTADCQITLTGAAIQTQQQAAQEALTAVTVADDHPSAPICLVLPTGSHTNHLALIEGPEISVPRGGRTASRSGGRVSR